MRDYDAIVPDLKWLRRVAPKPGPADTAPPSDEALEAARQRVTSWFNRLFRLYAAGLIQAEVVRLVLSPKAAALWLAYVAPLDRLIREGIGAEAVPISPTPATHPMEQFYHAYSHGHLLTVSQKE